jgi:hypothetical protein
MTRQYVLPGPGRKGPPAEEVAPMARFLAILLLGAAAVRLWFDWNASVSQGDPFAMQSLGGFWETRSPDTLASIQGWLQGMLAPEWQSSLLAIPFAALLTVIAAIFWIFGRRQPVKRKSFG